MHPTLFALRFGDHELGLHTYGVLVGAGFATGIVLFWREGRHQGLDGGRLLDMSFWSVIAGLLGSRIAFVALNLREFGEACWGGGGGGSTAIVGCTAALRFWEGGFVFYGGAVATAVVVFWFSRREGWSFWRIGDLAAPSLAVGHALGRLGCFFAGCCFGKACPTVWGVAFPAGSVAFQELQGVGMLPPGVDRTLPLHPTQLYEAAGEAVIFVVLLTLRHVWRTSDRISELSRVEELHAPPRRPGSLILAYAASYAVLRFGIEIFRGDSSRRFLVEWSWPRVALALGLPAREPLVLSVSQFASIVVLGAVVGIAIARRAEARGRRRRPS